MLKNNYCLDQQLPQDLLCEANKDYFMKYLTNIPLFKKNFS